MKTYSCEAYISSLDKVLEASLDAEHVFLTPLALETPHIIEDESDKKLQLIVNATCSLTSKEDLVEKLRSTLLLEIAKRLKCPKIFLADVETDLAIKLLSNISLGRGAQLPLDVVRY
jgi:cytoplasmic tRNA 2-thiolation protein 2